jgi:hypothetical protein
LNPRSSFPDTRFRGELFQPLRHLSAACCVSSLTKAREGHNRATRPIVLRCLVAQAISVRARTLDRREILRCCAPVDDGQERARAEMSGGRADRKRPVRLSASGQLGAMESPSAVLPTSQAAPKRETITWSAIDWRNECRVKGAPSSREPLHSKRGVYVV